MVCEYIYSSFVHFIMLLMLSTVWWDTHANALTMYTVPPEDEKIIVYNSFYVAHAIDIRISQTEQISF